MAVDRMSFSNGYLETLPCHEKKWGILQRARTFTHAVKRHHQADSGATSLFAKKLSNNQDMSTSTTPSGPTIYDGPYFGAEWAVNHSLARGRESPLFCLL